MKKSKNKQWIGIDLGGTKVAAAIVSQTGRAKGLLREPTNLAGGWTALKTQLLRLCSELQRVHGKVQGIGIGSAGPLHAPSGKLLDPTNFGWTSPLVVNLSRELSRTLRIPVSLENDAAAAVLAESWKGGGGKNCVVVTLGTGVGLGVVCDGKLVRGGRGLHPEGGHMLLRPGDPSAPCGCGNLGCAEAFLSGVNFGNRASRLLGESGLTGAALEARATAGDKRVLALFAEYSELLADYLQNLVVLYYPERVILTGSFAEAHPHFLSAARARLRELISRRLRTLPLEPEVRLSKLDRNAGVLGAAFVAMHTRQGKATYAAH
ncbi:MAG: ROK family protein [Bdellovibrionota bacterium]